MKKTTIILLAILFICGTGALSFAQTSQPAAAKKAEVSTEVVRGKIMSIDMAKNEIVVKENKSGIEKKIVVDPKVILSLKVDENVKVTVKAGSSVAESVKKIVQNPAVTKK